METVVYLIRHSEPFKNHRGISLVNESILMENEKSPLSINGEKMAEKWASNPEFKNLNSVWSSNYVRAMSTAKYFASANGIKVNIDERLNERVHGVTSYSELPNDFEERQINDINYKIGNGESQKEVQFRMINALNDIITENKGQRVAVISHATAITFLLKKWCDIKYGKGFSFNNIFYEFAWNYLETFKLTFDENNNLINIDHLQ